MGAGKSSFIIPSLCVLYKSIYNRIFVIVPIHLLEQTKFMYKRLFAYFGIPTYYSIKSPGSMFAHIEYGGVYEYHKINIFHWDGA